MEDLIYFTLLFVLAMIMNWTTINGKKEQMPTGL